LNANQKLVRAAGTLLLAKAVNVLPTPIVVRLQLDALSPPRQVCDDENSAVQKLAAVAGPSFPKARALCFIA
jgi:hypothetical protein